MIFKTKQDEVPHIPLQNQHRPFPLLPDPAPQSFKQAIV